MGPASITPGAKMTEPKVPTDGLGVTIGAGDGRSVTIGVVSGGELVGKARVAVTVSRARVRVACAMRVGVDDGEFKERNVEVRNAPMHSPAMITPRITATTPIVADRVRRTERSGSARGDVVGDVR